MVEEEAVAVEKQSLAASAGGAAAAALESGAVTTVRAPLAAERQLRPSIMWLGNDRMKSLGGGSQERKPDFSGTEVDAHVQGCEEEN